MKFEPTQQSPGSAREAVAKLRERLPEGTFRDLELVVSELVTNSVRHGGLSTEERIGLRTEISNGTLRLEVTDPGSGLGDLPTAVPDPGDKGGWGLYLARRLADRLGSERSGGLTRVWAEWDLAAEQAAAN